MKMSIIRLSLSIAMSLSLIWIASCTREALIIDEPSQIDTEWSRLSFDTGEEFHEAWFMFSDTESKSYSYENDIKPWEQSKGFKSMRGWYEDLVSEFERISSDEELDKFVKQNKALVRLSEGAYEMHPPINGTLMNVLAPDGTVEIVGALYKYTPDRMYIVLDKDMEKLAKAVKSDTPDEENGVFIIKDWQRDELDLRTTCNGAKSLVSFSPQINDKRVTGDWSVILSAVPVRDFANPHLVLGWQIGYQFNGNVNAQKRGWFGRWVSNKTRLGFETGFGIQSILFGDATSGTGWSTGPSPGDDVSSISVSFMVQGPAFSPGFAVPPSAGNFAFFYCTGGVKDFRVAPVTDVHPGIFTYACCPWDCSDRDWNTIQ